jgi:hypothetical protein
VHGFHWAFAGAAVFVVVGLAALLALLRGRHVATANVADVEPVAA